MEDTDVLQHLLGIEGQAAALVDDAQTEADRRVRAAEEQNRLAHDGAYQELTAVLEAEHQKNAAAAKAEYGQTLDEYRRSLDQMPLNNDGFSALVFSLLVKET